MEVNIAGVYVAPIAVYCTIAVPLFLIVRAVLGRAGVLRAIWHPALFEFALYLAIVSLLVLYG